MKKEITSKKKKEKPNQSQTNNVTVKDKRPSFFYFTDFEQVFVGWLISFVFSFLDYWS